MATWTDASGLGNDLTQAVAGNRPTVSGPFDGHATVAFTDPGGGNLQFLDIPAGLQRGTGGAGLDGQSQTTVYAVCFSVADASDRGLMVPAIGIGVYSNFGSSSTWGVFSAGEMSSGQPLAGFKQICAAWDRVPTNSVPFEGSALDLYTDGAAPVSGYCRHFNTFDAVIGADANALDAGRSLEGEIALLMIFAGRHDPNTVTQMQAWIRTLFPSLAPPP